MPDTRQDRISRLSARFGRHTQEAPAGPARAESPARDRHSFYLRKDLVRRIDQQYRQVAHELYPLDLSKSTFLEAILERGLADVEQIKAVLAEQVAVAEASE